MLRHFRTSFRIGTLRGSLIEANSKRLIAEGKDPDELRVDIQVNYTILYFLLNELLDGWIFLKLSRTNDPSTYEQLINKVSAKAKIHGREVVRLLMEFAEDKDDDNFTSAFMTFRQCKNEPQQNETESTQAGPQELSEEEAEQLLGNLSEDLKKISQMQAGKTKPTEPYKYNPW